MTFLWLWNEQVDCIVIKKNTLLLKIGPKRCYAIDYHLLILKTTELVLCRIQ